MSLYKNIMCIVHAVYVIFIDSDIDDKSIPLQYANLILINDILIAVLARFKIQFVTKTLLIKSIEIIYKSIQIFTLHF